ncbi:MAG: hypothetical protein HY738_17440 [Bacteroidia bacterium]|nr:hypothetical protein [Bacteroidia bacterium]
MKTKKIICKALMMMLLLSEFHAGYAQTGYQYYSVNQPAQLFVTAHASVSGVCPGVQVTLTGSGAVTYTWSR